MQRMGMNLTGIHGQKTHHTSQYASLSKVTAVCFILTLCIPIRPEIFRGLIRLYIRGHQQGQDVAVGQASNNYLTVRFRDARCSVVVGALVFYYRFFITGFYLGFKGASQARWDLSASSRAFRQNATFSSLLACPIKPIRQIRPAKFPSPAPISS